MTGLDPTPPLDPDNPDARSSARSSRRRLRWRVTLGLLALFVVLIILLPRSRELSKTLPAGRWGRTIACLERNQTYRITDAKTGQVPTSASREVIVHSTVHTYELADLRDAGSAAAAQAIARHNRLGQLSRSDYRVDGPIVWAYAEDGDPPHVSANAGDRTLIAFCVRTPTAH